MITDFLTKHNIKYEDLNAAERETLNDWYRKLESSQLSLGDVKNHIQNLIHAVEDELAAYDLPKEKDLLLKARLKNYVMLHDFLTAPEKARKYIEQSLKNIK